MGRLIPGRRMGGSLAKPVLPDLPATGSGGRLSDHQRELLLSALEILYRIRQEFEALQTPGEIGRLGVIQEGRYTMGGYELRVQLYGPGSPWRMMIALYEAGGHLLTWWYFDEAGLPV